MPSGGLELWEVGQGSHAAVIIEHLTRTRVDFRLYVPEPTLPGHLDARDLLRTPQVLLGSTSKDIISPLKWTLR